MDRAIHSISKTTSYDQGEGGGGVVKEVQNFVHVVIEPHPHPPMLLTLYPCINLKPILIGRGIPTAMAKKIYPPIT